MRSRVLRPVRHTALWAAVAAISGLLAVASPAHAAEPTFTIEAGVQSWFDPGDHVVVAATVEADELFDGRVDVVAASGAVVTRSVEVAGGTTKTVYLVAPTTLDSLDLDVRLYDGDDLLVRRSVTLKAAEEAELVGVLPGLRTRAGELPESVRLGGEMGTAFFQELTSERLSLGGAALDVYDTVVAVSADIRALTPAQRAALLGWVNRGGRLLLDDAGDLGSLPAEWRPGSAGYALAGRGEIRLIEGKATEGGWAGFIEPSGGSNSESEQMFFGEQFSTVQEDLARRAGVELPSLLPVLVPLLVYWLLVSIVLFIVLRAMRRLTLAWVAVPLLAALTGGGVLLYGNHWRDVGQPAVATFVDGYPGGGDSISSILLFSRDGGRSAVELPSGWQSDSEVSYQFGAIRGTITPEVEATGEGSRIQVLLDAGQVTTAHVTGPATDAGLEVTATVEGGQVVGTVTNVGPVALKEVAVFGPGGADLVGDLAPGKSAEYTFDADALPPGFSLADRVWRATSDPRATDATVVELGIWSNAGSGRVLFPSGMVRAAGWTTERAPAALLDATSTTVVSTTARVLPGDGSLHEGAVRWATVRSPFTRFGNGLGDQIYRYVLPPEAVDEPLRLSVIADLDEVELWSGSGWVKAEVDGRTVIVPPAAVRDGVVMVRFPNDGMFFGPDSAPTLHGVAE